jgi:hypothetical protein
MKKITHTLFKTGDTTIFMGKLNFYLAEQNKKHSIYDTKNKKFRINIPLPNNKFRIKNIYLYNNIGLDCLLIHITDDKEIPRRFDHRVFVGKITFDLSDIEFDVNRDSIINFNEIKIIIYSDISERRVGNLPDISVDFFNPKNQEYMTSPDDTGGGVITRHP